MTIRPDNTNRLAVVISGSFRRHYSEICELIIRFERLNVSVLSPRHSEIVNPGDDFVLLESDAGLDPEQIERGHLDAISRADALYLYVEEGRIGPSSAMEIGWALALGKPVYATELCRDAALRLFIGRAATPAEVKSLIVENMVDPLAGLVPQSSLGALQSYIGKVAAKRGFDKEAPRDKVLLMLEEFGELAKAVRRCVGLKIDIDREERYRNIKDELADILIYILDLANTYGVNLFDAFREKEVENSKRSWGNPFVDDRRV